MSNSPSKGSILVVGAGPAGLAAAIEFRRRGYPVRIIDRLADGAKESRAVAVNIKSLRVLEPSGATARLVERGVHVKAMQLVIDGAVAARIDTTRLPKPYDYLLCLPQNVTEDILTRTLADYGTAPERQVELLTFAEVDGGVTAQARHLTDGTIETITCDWLVAADGAHSTVRKALGLEFAGAAYPFQWSLADVDMSGDFAPDEGEARVSLGKPFVLRMPIAPGRNRLIATAPNVLDILPPGWTVNAIHWQSDFTVSHRMIGRRLVGHVALIGDASHIHSPAGGRGMNLGIEDAGSLAEAVDSGTLDQWEAKRLARARTVLKGSDKMQKMVTMQDGFLSRTGLRVVAGVLHVPTVQRLLLNQIAAVNE